MTEQSVNSKSELRSSPQVIIKEKMLIKGLVVDENDVTIPGAIVRFKDSELGTITDVDGNFILETNEVKSTYLLEVLYIGIDTKVVEAFSGKNLLVKLDTRYTGYTGDIVIVRRLNFWQRITKPLRKKQ